MSQASQDAIRQALERQSERDRFKALEDRILALEATVYPLSQAPLGLHAMSEDEAQHVTKRINDLQQTIFALSDVIAADPIRVHIRETTDGFSAECWDNSRYFCTGHNRAHAVGLLCMWLAREGKIPIQVTEEDSV